MLPENTTFKVDSCLCLKMLKFKKKKRNMTPQPQFNNFHYLSSIDFFISGLLGRRGKYLQPENKAFLYYYHLLNLAKFGTLNHG